LQRVFEASLKALFEIVPSSLKDCFRLRPRLHRDERGTFVKLFHSEAFAEHGFETEFRETFVSVSHRWVLRGLHFQRPPWAHTKLVTCLAGTVVDVVLDLRAASATYRCFDVFRLSGDVAEVVYVPEGFAHGFLVESETAVLLYHTSSVHVPEVDTGVRWNSCGIVWPALTPVVSARDSGLPTLEEYLAAPCF
jgi:dTDP-4-dehydrorhamnose 3,5-epimerase